MGHSYHQPTRRVFITAIGLVSSAGIGLEEFFDHLAAGKSGIKPITRFDTRPIATRQGGEVPLEKLAAPPTLPQKPGWDAVIDTKAFLAWTALQQMISGLPCKTPLFSSIGLERVDLTTLTNERYLSTGVCPEVPPTLLPGLLWQAAGFTGPTIVQVAACAASTIAIGTAFRTIRSGFFPAAVAGGVDSMLFPYGFHAFNSLGALSERNDLGPAALAPFDLHRSGTLLGEGAAYLALESEESLKMSRHTPIAEIIGYGSSMDAFHPVMPDPEGKGAIKAMQNALNDARISPQNIEYINAHGTGTPHNDKMEAKAVQTLFGQRAVALPISSIKPFVGHLLSAAGAIEAVASLLPFCRGLIPPTLHFSTPDPDCPVDCVPNTARKANLNIVMTNSYGFGGQNASLIFRKIR